MLDAAITIFTGLIATIGLLGMMPLGEMRP